MKKQVKLSNIAFKLGEDVLDSIKEHGINPDECDIIRKSTGIETKIKLEEGSRTAIKYVSTIVPDQIGDVVLPKGVDFKQFKQTGSPVFWGHNYSIPQIGSDEWIRADNYGIKVKQKYAESEDKSALCNVLWELTSQDMNKQSSVGLIPLEVIRVGDENFDAALKTLSREYPEIRKAKKNVRRIITKSLLFEHSDVGLGMNPSTSVEAVSKMYQEAGADEKLLKQLGLSVPVEPVEEPETIIEEKGIDEAEEQLEEIVEVLTKEGEEDNISVKDGEVQVEVDQEATKLAAEAGCDTVIQKVTMVQEPQTVKLIQKPAPSYKSIVKEMVINEVRRKKGRLV